MEHEDYAGNTYISRNTVAVTFDREAVWLLSLLWAAFSILRLEFHLWWNHKRTDNVCSNKRQNTIGRSPTVHPTWIIRISKWRRHDSTRPYSVNSRWDWCSCPLLLLSQNHFLTLGLETLTSHDSLTLVTNVTLAIYINPLISGWTWIQLNGIFQNL